MGSGANANSTAEGKARRSTTAFFLALVVAASGVVSPPVALAGGAAFGLLAEHPLRRESAAVARLLLQISVVALGFGMDFGEVLRTGRSGFVYTAVSISLALCLGLLLGRLLRVKGKAAYLITVGTAICGGSAIAAIAPLTHADDEEISVAMGAVFLLNSIALLLFPPLGHLVHLSERQFGLWAALAIHETSSVVGAAAHYGSEALAVGTTVKLTRALWIVPLSLATASYMARQTAHGGEGQRRTGIKVPWFIVLFCLAALLHSLAPAGHAVYDLATHLGRVGLTVTLFLIGTGLSRETLRKVGAAPLLQAVLLWVIVGGVSLWAIARGVLRF